MQGFEHKISAEASREALSCLANALILEEPTRQLLANLDIFPKAIEKLKVRWSVGGAKEMLTTKSPASITMSFWFAEFCLSRPTTAPLTLINWPEMMGSRIS
jgi:hypothetical protein